MNYRHRMSQKEALDFFRWSDAKLEGHFIYTSGRHGKNYVNKDAIYLCPVYIKRLCQGLVSRFSKLLIKKTQAVIAPAVGGAVLSHLIAEYMSKETDYVHFVASVYADKEPDGRLVIRRGYDKRIENQDVIILDDIMTTGGTVKKLVAEAKAKGANVLGAAVLWNRGGVIANDLGIIRLVSLVNKKLESWPEDDCPLCKAGVLVNQEVGKGREFLIRTQIVEPIEGAAKKLGLKVAAVLGGKKK